MRLFQREVSQRTTGTYKSTRTNLTASTLLTSGTDGSLFPDVRMPSARIKKKKPRPTKKLPNMPMDDELNRVLAFMDETSSRSSGRSGILHKNKSEQQLHSPPPLLSFMRRGSNTESVTQLPSERKPKILKSPSIRNQDRELQLTNKASRNLKGTLQRSANQKQLCPPLEDVEELSSTARDEIQPKNRIKLDGASNVPDNWLGNVLFVPKTFSPTPNPKPKGAPLLSHKQTFNRGSAQYDMRHLRRAKVLTYNDRMDGPALVACKPKSLESQGDRHNSSGSARDDTACPPPITVLQTTSSTSSISVLEWTESVGIGETKANEIVQTSEQGWKSTMRLETRASPRFECSAGEPTSTCIAMMMMKIQEQSHSSITHDVEDFQFFERTTSMTSGKWDNGGCNDFPMAPPKLESKFIVHEFANLTFRTDDAVAISSSSMKWKEAKKGLDDRLTPPVLESAQSSSSFHTLEWSSYSKYFDSPTSTLNSTVPLLKPTMSGSSALSVSPGKQDEDSPLQLPQRSISPYVRRLTTPEAIEIAPGKRIPMRGAEETMLYVATEVTSQNSATMIETFHCCACTSKIHGVNDAAFILCPVCQTVQPTENPCGFGVALGFLPEDWEGWKNCLMQK